MSSNPFNNTLDRTLRGKHVRVTQNETTYHGWVEKVHHGRGSVVLHDVRTGEGEELGSVFIRTPGVVEVLRPAKRIECRPVEELTPHPDHEGEFSPKDEIVRNCYRNQYAGSFPVVREDGTIINGHKRITAAAVAGLVRHPVEVIDVTDDQARELVAIAHRRE